MTIKLDELRIRNVRGIRQLVISPRGENAVLCGANGTGKSAVLDAITFLLTGAIPRLRGRRGVSLEEHGPNRAAELSEMEVEAGFRVAGIAPVVWLKRRMADPGRLQFDIAHARAVEALTSLAARGQHALERHGLLQFIASDPSDRAAQLQALLNLSVVESLRQSSVTAANRAATELRHAQQATRRAESAFSDGLGLSHFSEQTALSRINELRARLAGAPLQQLSDPKAGLEPPTFSAPPTRDSLSADRRLIAQRLAPEGLSSLVAAMSSITDAANRLRDIADQERVVRSVRLVRAGLELVGDGSSCPLCDQQWQPGRLRVYLQEKLGRGEQVQGLLRTSDANAADASRWIAGQAEAAERLAVSCRAAGDGEREQVMARYAEGLRELTRNLSEPLNTRPEGINIRECLRSEVIARAVADLEAATPVRQVDPLREAWDTLTGASVNLGHVRIARQGESSAGIRHHALELTRQAIADGREQVLHGIFEGIRDRFSALYRQLHAPDEEAFTSELEPTIAGVEMRVNFRGTGFAHPMALHSEGHQDSMGLCLFFALAECAIAAGLGFIVLDDVVTTVDAGHRRAVARLIAEWTANRQVQFIVTTHDQTWLGLLRSSAAVRNRNVLHLVNWTLEGGPVTSDCATMWDDIEAALASGSVRAAAASLRHGLEGFYTVACDDLRASVAFSMDGRYDFGDLFPSAISSLKDWAKRARVAARQWEQPERVADIATFEAQLTSAIEQAQAEQWAVNPNVHYNTWMNLSPAEFRVVANAHQRLCGLFECSACHGRRRVIRDGAEAVSVACPCGQCAWNIQRR